jgi:hypothetical protein
MRLNVPLQRDYKVNEKGDVNKTRVHEFKLFHLPFQRGLCKKLFFNLIFLICLKFYCHVWAN